VQATHSGSQSSDVCISIRNVSKSYVTSAGTHLALNNVSLDVMSGEFLVLLGPSGCGKTTLLRAIAGLEELNAGTISQADTLWSAPDQNIWMTPEERQLGMVFQSYALWPHMNVFENIAYPLRNIGTSKADIASKVQKALERMGLAHQASVYPGQLSGGQQQRVALARALVSENQIILFDEPCSALDPISTAKIEELIDELKHDYTIAIVTHNMQQAARVSQKTAFMYLGELIEYDGTNQIFTNPSDQRTQDYITGRFG
jgi:ABC-type sugar transport system ATPase subunit